MEEWQRRQSLERQLQEQQMLERQMLNGTRSNTAALQEAAGIESIYLRQAYLDQHQRAAQNLERAQVLQLQASLRAAATLEQAQMMRSATTPVGFPSSYLYPPQASLLAGSGLGHLGAALSSFPGAGSALRNFPADLMGAGSAAAAAAASAGGYGFPPPHQGAAAAPAYPLSSSGIGQHQYSWPAQSRISMNSALEGNPNGITKKEVGLAKKAWKERKKAETLKYGPLPKRPFTPYNLFFKYQRLLLLHELDAKEKEKEKEAKGKEKEKEKDVKEEACKNDDKDQKEGGDDESDDNPDERQAPGAEGFFTERRPPSVEAFFEAGSHLADRDWRSRRPHRRTHGKVSFTNLIRHVSDRWKALDEKDKAIYIKHSKIDQQRYREEVKAWKRRQGEVRGGTPA